MLFAVPTRESARNADTGIARSLSRLSSSEARIDNRGCHAALANRFRSYQDQAIFAKPDLLFHVSSKGALWANSAVKRLRNVWQPLADHLPTALASTQG